MPRTGNAYRVLARSELPVDTAALARGLIGKVLVREIGGTVLSGRIVETEAYPVGDSTGHAFRGETPRNRVLFLDRGIAYVYLAYGTSFLLNVSSEEFGIGGAVLLRALEPLEGIRAMQRHRGVDEVRDLARGPGRCGSIDATTASTCVASVRCGSHGAITKRPTSGSARASDCRAKRTVRCASTFAAIDSSAGHAR